MCTQLDGFNWQWVEYRNYHTYVGSKQVAGPWVLLPAGKWVATNLAALSGSKDAAQRMGNQYSLDIGLGRGVSGAESEGCDVSESSLPV